MKGSTHRLFGALTGAGLASLAGHDLPMVVMSGLVATAVSNGPLSPDMDQTDWWQALAAPVRLPLVRTVLALPRRLFIHRYGLTHWWGLPVAAWWFLIRPMPPEPRWIATMLLAGWVSHLLGDLVFGRLALLPWGGPRAGVGLRTDGFVESGQVGSRRGGALRLIPFGPTRVAILLAIAWVLWALPRLPDWWPSWLPIPG